MRSQIRILYSDDNDNGDAIDDDDGESIAIDDLRCGQTCDSHCHLLTHLSYNDVTTTTSQYIMMMISS